MDEDYEQNAPEDLEFLEAEEESDRLFELGFFDG